MSSTCGAVYGVVRGRQSGQQSVVEQRTVVEVVSGAAATDRPRAAAVSLPRRPRVQPVRRRLVVGRRGRGGEAEVGRRRRGSPQLPDVRVAVVSRAGSAGAGRGDAVQLADVFRWLARWRQHQRNVGSHRQRPTPRTIERSLPVIHAANVIAPVKVQV